MISDYLHQNSSSQGGEGTRNFGEVQDFKERTLRVESNMSEEPEPIQALPQRYVDRQYRGSYGNEHLRDLYENSRMEAEDASLMAGFDNPD